MREVIDVKAASSAADSNAKSPKLNSGIKPSANGLLTIDRSVHLQLFCKEPLQSVYAVDPEPLARGKFATVRRCVQLATQREFAAKLVRKRGRKRIPGLDSFIPDELIHEVAVLAQALSCPHIVTLHHVFDSPNELVLILELARGGDLQTILDEDRIPNEADAAKCLRDVLKGLSFLHRHDLAHLDIKPQNIVLSNGEFPRCDVKLCDFGISRLITNGTEVREIMGTPDYVAPEVLNYEPISLATDMWSVGVLTYVLLTGCSPFGGDTKQDTYCNITKAIVDFPEDLFADISDLAKDFISRLLVKKPGDRMKADECLRHPWLKSGKYEIPRPDSIPIMARQESCPACGSGNSTPVNSTPVGLPLSSSSSFSSSSSSGCDSPLSIAAVASAAMSSPRGRRLSNLTPSTDSLDSDTSVETVKAVGHLSKHHEDHHSSNGDLNASKRYSASTETVTSMSSTCSASSLVTGHHSGAVGGFMSGMNNGMMQTTTSMTSLRSPYCRRRSSMESLTPRFSASIRSIPETMRIGENSGYCSSAVDSAQQNEGEEHFSETGFPSPGWVTSKYSASLESTPLSPTSASASTSPGFQRSSSGSGRKRHYSPAARFSLGHNTRLFPMLGEDEVDFSEEPVPCETENVPSVKNEASENRSGHLPAVQEVRRSSLSAVLVLERVEDSSAPSSVASSLSSSGEDIEVHAMDATIVPTSSIIVDAHNHSQNCCDDFNLATSIIKSQMHPRHFSHPHGVPSPLGPLMAGQNQPNFEVGSVHNGVPQSPPTTSGGPGITSGGSKDQLSPRLSRLSSETSSERSSGVFSDYSELSSDSSSDRSSVMSWEEMNDHAHALGVAVAAAGPRFQNSLEERFADLQLWESVWDEVHLRGGRRSCPGGAVRRGSAENGPMGVFGATMMGSKPWEKLCSGIVARAQAQIANKSTSRPTPTAISSNSLYCRSLGRSLGQTVSRSVAMLAEKTERQQPPPPPPPPSQQSTPVSSPKKPTRAPPLPPSTTSGTAVSTHRVQLVGAPSVRKLSAAFDGGNKPDVASRIAHAR